MSPPTLEGLRPQLLTLSAPTPRSLEGATDELTGELEGAAEAELSGLARRLHTKRPVQAHRRVVVAAHAAEAARYLRNRDPRRVFTMRSRPDRSLVFMCAGVGDQYPGMAAGLYRHLPVFRRELDRCFRLLRPELGLDLHPALYPGGPEASRAATRPDLAALFDRREPEDIHRTLVAQPLMFAVQYATARTLMSMGAVPSAMLGYSLGEYVAACLAGVLSLESALRLVAVRARLMADLPEGGMLAVMAAPEPLVPYLGDGVSVAALNGPELTVLTGEAAAIERTGSRLIDDGIPCRRMATSHAFHSPMMQPVSGCLRDLLAGVELRPPAIPFLSNLTGSWILDEEATSPEYWARHLSQPIRFADELAEVWNIPAPALVELGPGGTLGNLAERHSGRPARDALVLRTLPGPFEETDDLETLVTAAGRLWTAGIEIEWPDQRVRTDE